MTDILKGVYFICDSGGVKIGFSHDIQKRMTDLQTGNSDKLYLLGYIPCESDSEMNLKEKLAHGEFDKHRKINEWFHKKIKPEARKYQGFRMHARLMARLCMMSWAPTYESA